MVAPPCGRRSINRNILTAANALEPEQAGLPDRPVILDGSFRLVTMKVHSDRVRSTKTVLLWPGCTSFFRYAPS